MMMMMISNADDDILTRTRFSGNVIGGFDPGYFAGTRAAGGYSYIKIMHERHYRDSRDNIAHPLFKMMVKKMIYI